MSLIREGQTILGTYKIERFLGEGAFAEVYRVKHRFLGRQAMKVFKTVGMTIEETEQTLGEAILLSRIGHPNIIRVFDANITDTSKGICGFFTMEYIAGGSLEQFWRSYGSRLVPIETVVDICTQVCQGLAIAHSEKPPVIHRDIKPQNILVGYEADGLRVRVSDFGLAKRVNPLTLMASARGTRCFKAPEAFLDFQSDSRRGDVWAIGTTMYLLLTDRLPFIEIQELDLLDAACFDRPMIPPSRLNPQVDQLIDQIIHKALAIDPEQRYPTAWEFLQDLKKWKPRKSKADKSDYGTQSGVAKSALGTASPVDVEKANQMADQALKLSRELRRLAEAADLMEEAFNKCPDLRGKYEYQVKLWRRGVSM